MHKSVIQTSFDETRENVILMSKYGQIMKSTVDFDYEIGKSTVTCHHFYLKEDGNLVCLANQIVVEGSRAFSMLLGINCLDKRKYGTTPNNVGVTIPAISEDNKKRGIAYISFLILKAEEYFNLIKDGIPISSDIWREISNFIFNTCPNYETFIATFDDSQSLQEIVFDMQHREFANLFHSVVKEALEPVNYRYNNNPEFLPKQ